MLGFGVDHSVKNDQLPVIDLLLRWRCRKIYPQFHIIPIDGSMTLDPIKNHHQITIFIMEFYPQSSIVMRIFQHPFCFRARYTMLHPENFGKRWIPQMNFLPFFIALNVWSSMLKNPSIYRLTPAHYRSMMINDSHKTSGGKFVILPSYWSNLSLKRTWDVWSNPVYQLRKLQDSAICLGGS